MKTIVRKDNNISLYLVEDTVDVIITEENVTIGNPAEVIVFDCNESNVFLFENVSSPADWHGWKYFYTSENGWSLNPDWQPL